MERTEEELLSQLAVPVAELAETTQPSSNRLGTEHPNYARTIANLGRMLTWQGQLEKGLALLTEAVDIRKKVFGDNSQVVASNQNLIAWAYQRAEETAKSRAVFVHTLAVFEKAYGLKHPMVADSLTGIGYADIALGQLRRAIEPLERALAIRSDVADVEPSLLAETKAALAQALWVDRGSRARALALAREAETTFAGMGKPIKPELASLRAWLRSKSRR